MLSLLRIRGLAVIEDLSVEFGPGFNVLTGETGAGKSIVVDALGLVAGDRADTRLVRTGADRATVEAVFDVGTDAGTRALLESSGIDGSADDGLIVRREVAPSGGGRVFLNGSPSAVAVLRQVAEGLVEIHGQHEHQTLLRPDRHRDLLDEFGGLRELGGEVRNAYERLQVAAERIERLRDSRARKTARAEELRQILAEIDATAPRPGESDELDRERRVLRNAGRVADLLTELVQDLYEGSPSAGSLASRAARRASELAEIDPSLEEVAGRIEAARVDLEDAGATLRDYRDRADFDPARLEHVEARRAALEKLRLKYGDDEEAILAHRDDAELELRSLETLDEEVEAAERERREAEKAYGSAAGALTRERRNVARKLGPAIERQLAALSLPRARFGVVFDGPREPGPRGVERAEFRLTANPGEEARPLARVASGGELSRVMLAIHAVLEGAGAGKVLVFDEVDAGVGGAVADAVGSRLARLGRRHQVLCVTHLPQVAAHADRHYHVRKTVRGGRTRTEIVGLDGAARVDELARMLGGKSVTRASRRNAAELLSATARAGREA